MPPPAKKEATVEHAGSGPAVLDGSPDAAAELRAMLAATVDLFEIHAPSAGVGSGSTAAELAEVLKGLGGLFPEEGRGGHALAELGAPFVRHANLVAHPHYLSHFHSPALLVGIVAETLAAMTNQSVDSFDQGPMGTVLESALVDELCDRFGLFGGSGVFTSGATLSNLMGLLAARANPPSGADPGGRLHVLASRSAHFSVQQAAGVIGDRCRLLAVEDDPRGRMDTGDLRRCLERVANLRGAVGVVATAGTTTCGAIDPLAEIAGIAHAHGAWLHVDAAAGGAFALSQRHRALVAGVEQADSVAFDFHKLLCLPIACGAFLCKRPSALRPFRMEASYLDGSSAAFEERVDLVERSLQTTRRADSLKVAMLFRSLGESGVGAMLDAALEGTTRLADAISGDPAWELYDRPQSNVVVFRPAPSRSAGVSTDEIREHLYRRGVASLGVTVLDGDPWLRAVVNYPGLDEAAVAALLAAMVDVRGARK